MSDIKSNLMKALDAIENIPTPQPTAEEKIVKRYVETYWSRCPYPGCGSDDITGGFLEVDGKVVTQMCHCNVCEKSWQNQYMLFNAILFDPVE